MMASIRLFTMMDTDENGLLSVTEIREFLSNGSLEDVFIPEMQQSNVKLDYAELRDIWGSIIEMWQDDAEAEDKDGITMTEFIGAAMRFHGEAKSRDLLSM